MDFRLAYLDVPAVREALMHSRSPSLLVSYVYLDKFLKNQADYIYRDWVLDSGAFSAYMSGTVIELSEYMDTCKELIANDTTLSEVFALDAIDDWRQSIRNCEIMWSEGIPAIPCYHAGEPWDALIHIAKHYPKIAIGGVARKKGTVKLDFAKQCFARVWPKLIHGFGYGTADHILAVPFHSVDATNWEFGPCAFGRWQTFGNLSVRGSRQNLSKEVEFYLELEQKAQAVWGSSLSKVEEATVKEFGEFRLQALAPRICLVGAREGTNKQLSAATKEASERQPVDARRVHLAHAHEGQGTHTLTGKANSRRVRLADASRDARGKAIKDSIASAVERSESRRLRLAESGHGRDGRTAHRKADAPSLRLAHQGTNGERSSLPTKQEEKKSRLLKALQRKKDEQQ